MLPARGGRQILPGLAAVTIALTARDIPVGQRATTDPCRAKIMGSDARSPYRAKPSFCKHRSVNVRFAPKATEVLRCRELTGCAISGREESQQNKPYSITSSAMASSPGGKLRQSPGGVEVDHELELGRLHDRQVAGLLALENPADVHTGVAVGVAKGRSRVCESKTRHEFGTPLMAARWVVGAESGGRRCGLPLRPLR
jgi:hypothetical protein